MAGNPARHAHRLCSGTYRGRYTPIGHSGSQQMRAAGSPPAPSTVCMQRVPPRITPKPNQSWHLFQREAGQGRERTDHEGAGPIARLCSPCRTFTRSSSLSCARLSSSRCCSAPATYLSRLRSKSRCTLLPYSFSSTEASSTLASRCACAALSCRRSATTLCASSLPSTFLSTALCFAWVQYCGLRKPQRSAILEASRMAQVSARSRKPCRAQDADPKSHFLGVSSQLAEPSHPFAPPPKHKHARVPKLLSPAPRLKRLLRAFGEHSEFALSPRQCRPFFITPPTMLNSKYRQGGLVLLLRNHQ